MRYEPGTQVTVPQGTPMYPWPGVPAIRRDTDTVVRVLGQSTDDSRKTRILWRNEEYVVYTTEVHPHVIKGELA